MTFTRKILAGFLAGVLAGALATAANASIVVDNYSMQDGALLHGAYFDNDYNGNHSASGFLSGGKGDLTNGVLSADVSAGYGAWAPYVLWDGFTPVITFDLGAVYTLSAVTSYFKYYPAAAVFMPDSIALRFSGDGVNFHASQLRLFSDVEQAPGGDNADGVEQLLAGTEVARFVELTLNNTLHNRWLALGEVVFEGSLGGVIPGANNVPEPTGLALGGVALLALFGGLGRQRRAARSALQPLSPAAPPPRR